MLALHVSGEVHMYKYRTIGPCTAKLGFLSKARNSPACKRWYFTMYIMMS